MQGYERVSRTFASNRSCNMAFVTWYEGTDFFWGRCGDTAAGITIDDSNAPATKPCEHIMRRISNNTNPQAVQANPASSYEWNISAHSTTQAAVTTDKPSYPPARCDNTDISTGQSSAPKNQLKQRNLQYRVLGLSWCNGKNRCCFIDRRNKNGYECEFHPPSVK